MALSSYVAFIWNFVEKKRVSLVLLLTFLFMEIWSKTVAITSLIEVRKEVATNIPKRKLSALLFKYIIYGLK